MTTHKDDQQKPIEQYEETIFKIEQSLHQLDEGVDVNTPDLKWFEQMVQTNQKEMRRKLQKEILLFMVIASVILSAVIFTLFEMPTVFLVIQGIATLFIFLYSGTRFIKQVNGT